MLNTDSALSVGFVIPKPLVQAGSASSFSYNNNSNNNNNNNNNNNSNNKNRSAKRTCVGLDLLFIPFS